MALTAAIKSQIAQWYKALQQQIPDFIPRAPQRQMIAEVAKTLAGDDGRHLAIEAPTGVGKTLSYLIPGIAVGRAEEQTLGGQHRQRGAAGSDLQQRFAAAEENHPRSEIYRRLWPWSLRLPAQPGGAGQPRTISRAICCCISTNRR